MGGACSTYGEWRAVYSVLVWQPEGKISLRRQRRIRRIILKGFSVSGDLR
jgi:hypothetical protein